MSTSDLAVGKLTFFFDFNWLFRVQLNLYTAKNEFPPAGFDCNTMIFMQMIILE
jgi:hypothetical protein